MKLIKSNLKRWAVQIWEVIMFVLVFSHSTFSFCGLKHHMFICHFQELTKFYHLTVNPFKTPCGASEIISVNLTCLFPLNLWRWLGGEMKFSPLTWCRRGKKGEDEGGKMMQSWKMASAKDNERTGREEDSRDGAEGRIDRWATAGSAVWEKHTVINYNGCRNYNYTS